MKRIVLSLALCFITSSVKGAAEAAELYAKGAAEAVKLYTEQHNALSPKITDLSSSTVLSRNAAQHRKTKREQAYRELPNALDEAVNRSYKVDQVPVNENNDNDSAVDPFPIKMLETKLANASDKGEDLSEEDKDAIRRAFQHEVFSRKTVYRNDEMEKQKLMKIITLKEFFRAALEKLAVSKEDSDFLMLDLEKAIEELETKPPNDNDFFEAIRTKMAELFVDRLAILKDKDDRETLIHKYQDRVKAYDDARTKLYQKRLELRGNSSDTGLNDRVPLSKDEKNAIDHAYNLFEIEKRAEIQKKFSINDGRFVNHYANKISLLEELFKAELKKLNLKKDDIDYLTSKLADEMNVELTKESEAYKKTVENNQNYKYDEASFYDAINTKMAELLENQKTILNKKHFPELKEELERQIYLFKSYKMGKSITTLQEIRAKINSFASQTPEQIAIFNKAIEAILKILTREFEGKNFLGSPNGRYSSAQKRAANTEVIKIYDTMLTSLGPDHKKPKPVSWFRKLFNRKQSKA